MMSRSDHTDVRPVPVALTPQLPPRAHRPLCMSVSSDSSGRFKALETQEWKNNLKAQVRPSMNLLIIHSAFLPYRSCQCDELQQSYMDRVIFKDDSYILYYFLLSKLYTSKSCV